jgi:hypothetical protein
VAARSGAGLGWVDLHLLASASLAGWRLLTAGRAMAAAAMLGIQLDTGPSSR